MFVFSFLIVSSHIDAGKTTDLLFQKKEFKKFLLLHAILKSNVDKDVNNRPKISKPLDLYQPEAIALLKDLPIWLQKPLQDKQMVRVFNKVKN